MTEISVIVPLYNEAANIDALLTRLRHALSSATATFEIIAVDDGSNDDTWRKIDAVARGSIDVRGLKLTRNFGKEPAIMAGLKVAKGRAVLVMDGDLQHPPELAVEMIRAWREQSCLVVEARKTRKRSAGIFATMRSRIFYWLFQRLTGIDLEGASDFKLLDRRVVDALQLLPERTLFFRAMTSWVGFGARHVLTFDAPPRPHGKSGWSTAQLFRLGLDAITAYSAAPLRLITVAGVLLCAVSAVLGAQALRLYVAGTAVPGFTTVILLQLLIGGLVILSLGIIGEYLARIFEEVKARPRYIIEQDTHGT